MRKTVAPSPLRFGRVITEWGFLPIKGDTVQRINEHQFYDLGMRVHPIREIKIGELTVETAFTLWGAREALFALLQQIPLRICQPVTQTVIYEIDTIIPREIDAMVNLMPDPDEGKAPQRFSLYKLHKAVEEFETILAAELQALDTYFISQKGAYSTPDLIERAEILFPDPIRRDLPPQAITDIREAGRCLAFDVPTAVGFHTLRAVEAVMVEYYKLIIGTAPPTRMRNWGIYIEKIRKTGKADPKILDFLDHIRSQYRNPISHPEVNLSLDEAEILLGTAASAIRQMVVAIQKNRPSPAPPILPLPPSP